MRRRPKADPAVDVEPWALRHSRYIVVVGTAVAILIAAFAILAGRYGWLAARETTTTTADGKQSVQVHRDFAGVRDSFLRLAAAAAAATAGLLAWGRLELSRIQHRLDRQSQNNERFARSVELLGNDDESVRLGALYALEGLASDGFGRQAVYDLVCGYARARNPSAVSVDEIFANPRDEAVASGTVIGRQEVPAERVRTTDHDAAVSIALRVPVAWKIRLDLTGVLVAGKSVNDLSLCRLDNAEIQECVFSGALSACNFRGATLESCEFSSAMLADCSFDQATVDHCEFVDCELESVSLAGARQLESCYFENVLYDVRTVWPSDAPPAGTSLMTLGPA